MGKTGGRKDEIIEFWRKDNLRRQKRRMIDKEDYLQPCNKAFEIYQQSPYGDMWQKMSYYELLSIAAYKARRATLLNPGEPKIRDDILDAINFLIFAFHQLTNAHNSKGQLSRIKEARRTKDE